MTCPLCESTKPAPFKVLKKPERSYFHCEECDLIFMHPQERLSASEEKQRYDYHQNQDTAGYRAFLDPLVNKMEAHFKAAGLDCSHLHVLDYGCGPTAYLSTLLLAKDFLPANYDPFYFPDQEQLHKTYHAITSTEVWEHFHSPKVEIERQLSLLKPGGLLAVMTSAHKGEAAFHDWHYRRDLTHVSFFSENTMRWIQAKYRLHLIQCKSPYFVFQKLF